MGSNPWVITEAKDGYLKGTVQAQASKMTLFTTIPYEKGWNIYVDGKKAAYKGFYNAFIQIPLEKEGMHEVEMIYHAPGLVPGLIISAASLILFIILCLIKKKKQSKKSLK
ncbi:MAG: YfhO family protein [Lachnospiraceae bacterium]|nr:YfhO family protein [Lachnospiraceae bacterium]